MAVILGTAGLDCVHECRMEIHPVYAMAVRSHSKSKHGVGDEWWSIFVRNWASSEGQCSSRALHRLPEGKTSSEGQKVLIILPPIEGVAADASTRIGLDSLARTNSAWVSAHPIRVEAKAGTGTVLEFSLPSADNHAIAETYLHICRGTQTLCGVEQKAVSPGNLKKDAHNLPATFEISAVPLKGISSGRVYFPVPEDTK